MDWAAFEQRCEAELVRKYGNAWRTEQCVREQVNGVYLCLLCNKQLDDLGRVIEHVGTFKHQNKQYYVVNSQDPLAEIPLEQHRFVNVGSDGLVRCRLCRRSPVCTAGYLASAMHVLRV